MVLDAAARRAPVLVQFDKLREELGSTGVSMDAEGELKLARLRRLVETLDTGDEFDPVMFGGRYPTTTIRQLKHLKHLIGLGLEAGAVTGRDGRLRPAAAWPYLSPVRRTEKVWRALLEVGPLSVNPSRQSLPIDALLEAGMRHWLIQLLVRPEYDVTMLIEDEMTMVEHILEGAGMIDPMLEGDDLEELEQVLGQVPVILEQLEALGVIGWRGSTVTRPEGIPALWFRKGGTVWLTDLGRHLVAGIAEETGYRLPTLPDPDPADTAELLAALDGHPDADLSLLWQELGERRDPFRLLSDFSRHPDPPADRVLQRLSGVVTVGRQSKAIGKSLLRQRTRTAGGGTGTGFA